MTLRKFIPLCSRHSRFQTRAKSLVTDDKSFAVEIVTQTQKGDFPGLPATGKHFSIKTCSFGEFENGKIKGRRDYWDLVTLREQLLGKRQKLTSSLLYSLNLLKTYLPRNSLLMSTNLAYWMLIVALYPLVPLIL